MTRCGPRNLPLCFKCHARVPKTAECIGYTRNLKRIYLCGSTECAEKFDSEPINPPRKSGRLDC